MWSTACRKSDPKFVTFSIKSRCLQYRHSDSVSEPAYKTVSLLYASYVRELPLVHEALLDCLTPGQALAAPSEMLSGMRSCVQGDAVSRNRCLGFT